MEKRDINKTYVSTDAMLQWDEVWQLALAKIAAKNIKLKEAIFAAAQELAQLSDDFPEAALDKIEGRDSGPSWDHGWLQYKRVSLNKEKNTVTFEAFSQWHNLLESDKKPRSFTQDDIAKK